jgi:type 1 glutamine amidotransferase
MSRSLTARLWLALPPVLVFVLGATSQGQTGGPGRQDGRGGPNPNLWPGKKHLLLVADVETGYHHDAINHQMAVIERMGRESGEYMTMLRTDSQLLTKDPIPGQGPRYAGRPYVNAKNLDFFDAIFLMPSGVGKLSERQKAAVLSFIRDDGKGILVGHAATVGYYQWPEYTEMIGGAMNSEFAETSTVVVEDPKFPGADAFGLAPFPFFEQHPVLKAPYSPEKLHVILRLDPDKLSAQNRARRPDGDFPVAWARQYGKGRMYNIGWGEFEETWDDLRFQKMILGAIKWAIGTAPADVTPRPLPEMVRQR